LCPNNAFNGFMRLYKDALESAFPLKSIEPNRKYITRDPRVTERAERERLSWGEAQASAKDRTFCQNIVVVLCPTGDEEDK